MKASLRIAPAILLLLAAAGVSGQSFDTSMGGSQLMGLAGVQTNFQYGKTYGWTGIGYYDGFQMAGYVNTPLRKNFRLGLGDQAFDAGIATDEYDYYRVAVRGSSVLHHTAASDTIFFVGYFSADDQQPYFHSVYRFNPNLVTMTAGHIDLSRTLRLQTFNVYGNKITSIQSLAWSPVSPWHFSAAVGTGASQRYFSSASEYHKGELDFRVSYTDSSHDFHRQDGTYGVEPLGLNTSIVIPAGDHLRFRYSHRHELFTVPHYLGFQQNSSIGIMDTAGLSAAFFGFRAAASVAQSSSNTYAGEIYTGTASVSRQIIPRLRSTYSYLHSAMPLQDIQVHQLTSAYRINPHITVSHTFALMNGTVSNTFGGGISFNAISLSAENQVYTSPIAAQFGQSAVFQAWNFSLRFRTPHGTQSHLESVIDPLGRTQWGGYLSGLHYRAMSSTSPSEDSHVSFSKYLIRGKVVNESGKGVWGIAIRIGSELVMSGPDGGFSLHVKNNRPVAFAVISQSSLQSVRWTLDAAPTSAQGNAEGDPPVTVVVRMASPALMAEK